MSTVLPPDIQLPRTISEMRQAIALIRGLETVRVVPHLTRIDRLAAGWLTILTRFFIGISLALGLLAVNISILAFCLTFTYWQVVEFIKDTRPGLWVHPRWDVTQNISEGAIQAGIAILWIIAGILLYRSASFRKRLKASSFWLKPGMPPWGLRIPLRLIQVTALICMAVFAGFFVTLALFPIAYLLLDLWASLTFWLDKLAFFRPTLRELWRWGAAAVSLLVIFVFLSRKTPRRKLVRLNLLVAGGGGLADILLTGYYLGWSDVILLVVGALPLVYPIGLALPLSNLFIGPFVWFRNVLYTFSESLLLRWEIFKAMRYHRRRNRKQTGGDIWATVCQEHILRFEKRHERISYRRKFIYGCCPTCQDDVKVYQGVECLALKLDIPMTAEVEQVGPTLWINGLRLLGKKSAYAAPPYDAVVVGQVDDHDVEHFILSTTNQAVTERHKPLSQLPARIAVGSNITTNDLHVLHRNAAQVTEEYDAAATPNPFMGKLRVVEAVQKGSRRVRRLVINTLKILLVLAVLLGLAYLYFQTTAAGFSFEEIPDMIESWWESIR